MSNYSIRIGQIKLSVSYSGNEQDKQLAKKVCKKFNELLKIREFKSLFGGKHKFELSEGQVTYKVVKRSVDSRYKPDIYYIYTVDIEGVSGSVFRGDIDLVTAKMLKLTERGVKLPKDISIVKRVDYEFPLIKKSDSESQTDKSIVIVGFGPAGMFTALKLVEAGFKPVIYERGEPVEARTKTVNHFWETGELNTESNVQFGEGGAGTFSDGKLNTMIKDPTGRIKEVLSELVRFGADPSILYVNKPHIGTDVLSKVVRNIREFIVNNGGEIHFNSKVSDVIVEDGTVKGVSIENVKTKESVTKKCDCLCLAIGHSARDTFAMLESKDGIAMEAKAFAVGLRLEHPQQFIDDYAYGDCPYEMPAADYKVTCQTSKGRGVYSFCMCPGGYVVNASSEEGRLAVNGMSYSGRDSSNANSALIVTVTPDDFGKKPLDGVVFQRELEKKAYEAACGAVPVQLLKDFKEGVVSQQFGNVIPCIKGEYRFAKLNDVLPMYVTEALIEGVDRFAGSIAGFNMDDAVFSGVESRTSSPVRILRGDTLESPVKGLFPCGEGAGYAGGITSAAVDGIKVAEQIALKIAGC